MIGCPCTMLRKEHGYCPFVNCMSRSEHQVLAVYDAFQSACSLNIVKRTGYYESAVFCTQLGVCSTNEMQPVVHKR